MKRDKRVLLIGALLGLITVLLLNFYIASLDSTKEVGEVIVYKDILVAKEDISEHTKITPEMVEAKSIPEQAVHELAVLDFEKISSGVTKSEILKGEQILSPKIITENIDANLAYKVPDGMRAITMPVDEITGTGNYLIEGDKIDILVTYYIDDVPATYTQFQNIKILKLGGLKAGDATMLEESTTPSNQVLEQPSSITILATPTQAEEIAYATLNGNIHVTLRNPLDEEKLNLKKFEGIEKKQVEKGD